MKTPSMGAYARRLMGGAVLASTLAGCEVGPTYVRPDVAIPASLAAANAPHAATPLTRVEESEADLQTWWAQFHDTELNDLVHRGLAQNLDRQTAASRIREARQVEVATRAALYPSLNADADYDHTHISQNAGLSSITSLLGGGGGSSVGTAGPAGIAFDSYTLGLDASWTLDLFGGSRRAVEAARARQIEQVWSARDTEVTVVSQIALAYLTLRADQAEIEVVQANVKSQRDLLALIGARAKGGLANQVDTVQQRSQLASTETQIAPLEADAASRAHQLALLLGQSPDALTAELAAGPDPVTALPPSPSQVPIGLPSELLTRRPDVREAERELAASVADVGQATAALYPKVQLTGSFDVVSTALKTLLEAESRNYTYGASLVQPLFDAGKLRAQKRQSQERAIQAALAYRKAVLTALQQSADALATYAADQRQVVTLNAAYADARRAADLDRAQYLGGLSDLTATLRAEASALQTQDQLTQTQARLSTDLVTLYRALGGGWNEGEPPPKKA